MVTGGVVLVVVVVLALAAVWPPEWAPAKWRHWTRPLRRRVRPKHYGHGGF
jgi:hypothetical protein